MPDLSDTYLIWSHEHGRWWASPSGYTSHLSAARHFTREAALLTCLHAIPGTASRMGALPELPVRLADVLDFASAFLSESPGLDADWS